MHAHHIGCDTHAVVTDVSTGHSAALGKCITADLECPDCNEPCSTEIGFRSHSVRLGTPYDAFAFTPDDYENSLMKFRCAHCNDKILRFDEGNPGHAYIDISCECQQCDEFDGWVRIKFETLTVEAHGDVTIDTQGTYDLANDSAK